jgi:predicted metalloprotease
MVAHRGPIFIAGAAACQPPIYFSQQYAVELWDETQDFGVAAAIAHEYAHNVQHDLGVLRLHRRSDMPFELMADCMAGMWANWAYYEGRLEAGDVNEAATAFYDVGDRRFRSRHHHGTPRQRRAAFLRGYAGGGRAHCERYLRKSRRSAHRR